MGNEPGVATTKHGPQICKAASVWPRYIDICNFVKNPSIFVCAQLAKMSPIYLKQSLDMKLLENCRSFIYECDHLGQLRQYAVCDRESL